MPGLAMVRLRRAGLERRTGRLDQAEELLREAVLQSKEAPALHAFYSIKLARLLLKLSKNSAKARSVLLEAIELCPVSGGRGLGAARQPDGDTAARGGGGPSSVHFALKHLHDGSNFMIF